MNSMNFLAHRRRLVSRSVLTFLVTSCLVFAVGGNIQAASWEKQWETTVEAAKKEGRVVVLLPLGRVYREWVTMFERAHPYIKLEATGARGREITPRIRAERDAGQYLWDVFLNAPGTGNLVFKPRGYLTKLRQALILPEILSDRTWLGGFEDGWIDEENQYLYAYDGRLGQLVHVNRDFIPENQFNSVEQLIESRWRGKIAMDDPRRPGPAASDLGHLLMVLGENWLRQFLTNDPLVIDNPRQLAEFVYRGRHPIAVSLRANIYLDFKQQGLTHVQPLAPDSEAGSRLTMTRPVGLFDRAPNPNAATVFVNWVLTREAQQHFSTTVGSNSRRLDVTGPADTAPNPKVKYRSVNKGKYQHFQDKAQDIAKEVLGKTR